MRGHLIAHGTHLSSLQRQTCNKCLSFSRSTDVTSTDLVSAKGKTKEVYCCDIVVWDTLRIFTSTLYGKTKTNTNRNPDPNRYRGCCTDPNAMIQKKELQIKTEEDNNFKAEKYQIEIEVN